VRVELTELVRVEIEETVTDAQLTERSGLSNEELTVLVEHGVLVPIHPASPQTFPGEAVAQARTALRLWRDFALDADAVALAMGLVNQVRALEAEVRHLRAQLPTGGSQ
jgi:hypothetical protein